MKRVDFLLFGIQGSGKGTHGKRLCETFGMAYFETGGELRKLAAIKSILEAGRLVPNEVVMEIVENFLKNIPASQAIVFDGIPRNEEQARSLEMLLQKHGRPYMGVLVKIPKEVAEERLLKRRLCEKCKKVFPPNFTAETCDVCGGRLVKRSDDTLEAIRTRFAVYEKETMPVIMRFKKNGKLLEIDGHGEMNEIYEQFEKLLRPYLVS